MSKKVKVRVMNDGRKGFFGRAREHARKLDRGEKLVPEKLVPEMTISFENPSDIVLILSPLRIRVLEFVRKKQGGRPVSSLASGLHATRAPSAATSSYRSSSDCSAPAMKQILDMAGAAWSNRARQSIS
jgi:hypothetical protein